MSDLAILISSHDGFKDIWPIQDECFSRFWPDCPYPIYWMTNGSPVPTRAKPIVVPKIPREEWGNTIAVALESVPEPLVILWIEEVIPLSKVETSQIEEMIRAMKAQSDIAAINVARYYHKPIASERLVDLDLNTPLPLISAMPSILRKEILVRILREKSKPNEFEQGSTSALRRLYPTMRVLCPTFPTFAICDNLLQFGWWRKCAIRHMETLGLTHLMDKSRKNCEDECSWMDGTPA